MVVPSPWSSWMISLDSLLTSPGDRAWNSGWNPSNSSVRFSAGVVRASGIVPPGGSVRPTGPAPWASSMYRWPGQVAVEQLRRDRGGQRPSRLHREADHGQVAAVHADRGHLAHPDAGDVHVVAHDQPGDVGEHGVVADRAGDPGVGDADRQQGRGQRRHHDEDDRLDQRPGDAGPARRRPGRRQRAPRLGVAGHRSVTSAPRYSGPTSRLLQSGRDRGACRNVSAGQLVDQLVLLRRVGQSEPDSLAGAAHSRCGRPGRVASGAAPAVAAPAPSLSVMPRNGIE